VPVSPAAKKRVKVILIILVVVILISPLLYIFVSSFKPIKEIMGKVHVFPKQPTIKNYKTLLFARTPVRDFPRILLNTLYVSALSALFSIAISAMSAYAIARTKQLRGGIMSKLLLFIYVFPTIIVLTPMYQLFAGIGLWDSYIGLVVVYCGLASPFCTWLLVSFFESIPKELEESAQVDGANALTRFMRIVLPITMPGVITVAAYAFITAWGEYMFALVMINSSAKKTAALGLATFTAEQYIEWGPLLAGSIIIILPIFVIFLPVSKLFIQGFMSGAVKG
jgi:multiple sugar transport system permease protein